MTTLRLDLAYHGAGFGGWAVQPGRRTVEAELGAALETLLGEPVKLSVAGRTDAGVHALAQVASLECSSSPPGNLRRGLNGLTGNDLVVHSAAAAPGGFDARRDATSRTYCYRLLASSLPNPFERGLSLWWPFPLEPEALDACAERLTGVHDFTAFTPTDTKHRHFERAVLRAEWKRDHPPGADANAEQPGGMLSFWIEADAFLRNMVRALVGTMLEVAGGRRELEDFERLLEGAPREEAGDTSQPHGLYLASVGYAPPG